MPRFVIEDVVTVPGRGTLITGRSEGRINPGDHLTRGARTTRVRGLERHCVPARPEIETVGLLVDLLTTEFESGQIWVRFP